MMTQSRHAADPAPGAAPHNGGANRVHGVGEGKQSMDLGIQGETAIATSGSRPAMAGAAPLLRRRSPAVAWRLRSGVFFHVDVTF